MSFDSEQYLGPFQRMLGLEVVSATDGHAEVTLKLEQWHSSMEDQLVAQGGVVFTLADFAGGMALVSLIDHPIPTIDMRIDYLKPATEDLRAVGTVLRDGSGSGVVDVTVKDDAGPVATARGVFKTGEMTTGSPWADDGE
ncbi:PaaI family thioesterase [Haladaptatus halobius]|uniref:PaaI family thioesterase n=1 Tax=Haladaptatus halobius TaxID=2884875 RepID=UPI001D0B4B0A|nr:PaaI family thioesterase [Haladaptatus halobius]